MKSLDDLESRLLTCFVETHEWDYQSGLSILIEYFPYESGVYDLTDYNQVQNRLHHTILSLQVF